MTAIEAMNEELKRIHATLAAGCMSNAHEKNMLDWQSKLNSKLIEIADKCEHAHPKPPPPAQPGDVEFRPW